MDGMVAPRADVAVIGGSGFYTLFDEAPSLALPTPYGEPSAPITIGPVGGHRVAFLPRHGLRHEYPPHCINYAA